MLFQNLRCVAVIVFSGRILGDIAGIADIHAQNPEIGVYMMQISLYFAVGFSENFPPAETVHIVIEVLGAFVGIGKFLHGTNAHGFRNLLGGIQRIGRNHNG